MKSSLPASALATYVSRQINRFFPDRTPVSALHIRRILPETTRRLSRCAMASSSKYFFRGGRPHFDHLNSDQYAMFLYLLARVAAEGGGASGRKVATKIYLLNKALHAIDAYFEIAMPEVFLFAHPLGTVLGRATYGNYFVVMQNCTVGNIDSRYPVLGEGVVLCSGASVLGDSVAGDGVCVGAGSLLINARIPANCTVVGRGKDLRILKNRGSAWLSYFRP